MADPGPAVAFLRARAARAVDGIATASVGATALGVSASSRVPENARVRLPDLRVVDVIDDVPVGAILVFSPVLSPCSPPENRQPGWATPVRRLPTSIAAPIDHVGYLPESCGRRSERGWHRYALLAVRAPGCFLGDEVDRSR